MNFKDHVDLEKYKSRLYNILVTENPAYARVINDADINALVVAVGVAAAAMDQFEDQNKREQVALDMILLRCAESLVKDKYIMGEIKDEDL